MKDPCDNPCIDGYYDKKNKINVICITRGYNDPSIDRSHCNPQKTTSSVYNSPWTANDSKYGPAIINLQKSFTTIPESIPYVRLEFVPYTQPSQPFVEPDEVDVPIVRIPEVNKAFHAKVKIGTNKYPYTYIIDTGAVITTISPKMYKANEGVIRKTGKSYTFVNADGSTNEAEEVFIDWIKIGGIELQNVRAVLKQKGDNLLGQNVLGKLKISIQKENNINIMTLKK